MNPIVSEEYQFYAQHYLGKNLIIKVSGTELEDNNFADFIGAIDILFQNGITVFLLFGGGVQIDEWYTNQTGKIREKKDGMGITTQEVLYSGVVPAYHMLSKKIQTLFSHHSSFQLITPAQVLVEPKIELGLVGTPISICLEEGEKLYAIGFVGQDSNGQLYNINADELVTTIAQQKTIDEVIFLTKTGGILDADGNIISNLSVNELDRLMQGEYPNATVNNGMIKKCKEIQSLLTVVPKVAIVKSDTLISELFTHQGAGTLCTPSSIMPSIPLLPVYKKSLTLSQGKGSWVWDENGRKYLDMTSGIAVNIFGHSDPLWIDAINTQLHKLTHISNYYLSPPEKLLAQKLVELSFADHVFFCNSGTEANEAALKIAKKYANAQGKENGNSIAFSKGFHGRTMGSLSTTANEKYRKPFGAMPWQVDFCEINNAEMFTAMVNDNTTAVILEPIQGEGGIYAFDRAFLESIRSICFQKKIVLIFDEVQCGLSRTGSLWAHEAFGVVPDIMTLAKPLAGGIPMGGVLVCESVGSVMEKGDHGNTFGGNPLACASALHVLDRINKPEFLAHVRKMGAIFKTELQKINSPYITEIRIYGLMIGIDITIPTEAVLENAKKNGLLILSAGENTLRILPPLNVKEEEIQKCVALLEKSLSDYNL